MEKEFKFSGEIVRCTYDTEDYKIYAVDVSKEKYPEVKHNKFNNVTILGELPVLTVGVTYEIVGIEQESKYGYNYKVTNIKREMPMNYDDMYLFLQEILTPNQAKVLWENYPDIVQRVKENRLDDIDLSKLHGIKEYTFNCIKQKIVENFCLADLVIEFQVYLNLTMIKKIYNKYSSIEVLKSKLRNDPYKCLCGLAGVGFKTADTLLLEIEKASKENVAKGKEPIIDFDGDLKTSPQRCLSCLLYLLQENENEGHTKMNLANLRSKCLKLVPACADHFVTAIEDNSIYYNKHTLDVSLQSTYNTEKYIADTIISALQSEQIKWDYDTEKYRVIDGVTLSDEQMQAVLNVCNYNISILNGAGGTGKSFSTQAIINMLNNNNKSFALFAPTGKASKVLADYTKQPARTIHRGLGYVPINNWRMNKEHKLHYDIIIVDEFSMVDINLFSRLIDAIDFKYTKLLIIGDNAQLPSVSCGNLLHDFMTTKLIPTTTLTQVFRYGEGGLMKVATDVRFTKTYLDNSMKNKMTAFGDNKDYIYVDVPSDLVAKNAVALYKKLLDMGNSIDNIQVLTAKNVGDCGTVVLNNMLQKVANPNYGSTNSLSTSETTYFKGDLIIQKVNNYKAEIALEYQRDHDMEDVFIDPKTGQATAFVANGETGIVEAIFDSYMIVNFDGIYIKYRKADLKMIGLGYCITIHKSQGSSIDNVILCTPQSHIFMMNSNLLYVGLTRMRKKCFHLGTLDSVNKAVKKKENLARNTFMQELLKEGVSNG